MSSRSYPSVPNEGGLNGVLSKVPPGWKVCVVSVMGGFQTGNLLQCDEVHGRKVSLEF